MNQTKKNFLYNIAYQLLILIIPLITTPYISRVLGTYGVGVYSYTYSIVYYFMLIGMLGINNYGNRTIAKSRDDKVAMSKNFFEIYFIQFSVSALMLICYGLYLIFFAQKEYVQIFLIQSLFIVSNMFNINWFFWGLEKFKLTVTRNTILKIASLICIFLFVKGSDDIAIYALILSGVSVLSEVILWYYLRKEVVFTKDLKLDNLKVHFKQCIILFIPVVAISLYKVMDKIMLGNFASVEEVRII